MFTKFFGKTATSNVITAKHRLLITFRIATRLVSRFFLVNLQMCMSAADVYIRHDRATTVCLPTMAVRHTTKNLFST